MTPDSKAGKLKAGGPSRKYSYADAVRALEDEFQVKPTDSFQSKMVENGFIADKMNFTKSYPKPWLVSNKRARNVSTSSSEGGYA